MKGGEYMPRHLLRHPVSIDSSLSIAEQQKLGDKTEKLVKQRAAQAAKEKETNADSTTEKAE